MIIKRIIGMYFSPHGTTKEIVNIIANNIGVNNIEEIDLTMKESRLIKRQFKEDELLIIGVPVYADRLPSMSHEIFENIIGNNTPTVAIVSYGNREYGDSLLELRNELIKTNMKVISAAAVIGQHCLNNNVATGRPDEEDKYKLIQFAKTISDKILHISKIDDVENIIIDGNFPYQPLKSNHTPIGDSNCIQCGICESNCPVNAIDKNDYRKTNSEICIFCGKCISICPTDARDMKEESFINFMDKLETIAGERKEIKVFN